MKHTAVLLFAMLLLGFTFAANLRHTRKRDDNVKRGLFTVVEGDVKKKQITAEEWIRAQKNADVNGGDRVRTLLQSRAEMQLAQLDVIRLAPQTTIDIVKLYEETKDKKIQTQLNLKEGDIWGKVKSVDANSTFEVNSDFAGAAITGTVFRVSHDSAAAETQLKVYTGEVRISNVPEKMDALTPQSVAPTRIEGPRQIQGPTQISVEDWHYLVTSYQQITIGRNGAVKSKGAFKRTDRDEASDWVRWNLQRDRLR